MYGNRCGRAQMLAILYYDVHIPPLVGFPVPVGVAIVVDCLVNFARAQLRLEQIKSSLDNITLFFVYSSSRYMKRVDE
jgi:hypothetical protein